MRHIGILAMAVALALAGSAPAARAQSAANPVPAKAAVCAACHGPEGHSASGMYPNLAAQTARYLYLQLRDFQEGRRSDPQMSPIAAALTRDEMRELADYYAKQKPAISGLKADPEKARLGKLKADETLCTMCHLGGFAGQNEIPRVAGQQYDYIVKQLSDFKARRRTNDAGNMTSVSNTLSDQDIQNLANYLVGL
jgi:cytochrome c553